MKLCEVNYQTLQFNHIHYGLPEMYVLRCLKRHPFPPINILKAGF